MGVMILPLVVVLVAGLLVLGMVCAERFPVRSWPSRIRGLVRNSQEVRLEEQDVEVEVVPQEARLSDLMTREGPAAYVGTDGFGGLVGVVGKAMDAAERTRGSAGSRRRGQVHEPAAGGLSQPQR
ncbi:hypothetical protein [Actinomyces oris]|uniref:Uncharacterized protein n=1 Tax=Actinomyces oris TaxID=544580 RepID=A0A1Q8VBU2_9ACTO|nr:hypothetical protein [Actinomyces oris]OLO45548.1 hypothetical protein BKH29_02950 [Actinomyces oris]